MLREDGLYSGWRRTLDEYPPVTNGELPGILGDLCRYMGPVGRMFPWDWIETLTLTLWSSAWPEVRVENLGLNLWWLGVNQQGVGKNITSDEMYKVFRDVAAARRQPLALYTSGSAEGMGRRLAGDRRALLAYHAEYAGFLKSLRQMPAGKELLCNLYDGRDVSHQLAHESIEAREPYVVVVATTTPAAITEAGNREDLSNGYLSRFLMCAPDTLNLGAERFRSDDERAAMVERVVAHITAREGVTRMRFRRDLPALARYQEGLGLWTGGVRDLDQARHVEDTPPGRLVARTKKIAALLSLADDGEPGVIEERHVELAIRFTQRADAYARRIAGWIGTTRGEGAAQKAGHYLAERGELTVRELSQLTHYDKRTLVEALAMMMQDGDVAERKDGRRVLYRLVR